MIKFQSCILSAAVAFGEMFAPDGRMGSGSLRSSPACGGAHERFVDQYGDGDTSKYADHYGGSRGKNDTCGCGESARERDERRACGCEDTGKYADHYGGGAVRNDTCGCGGGRVSEGDTDILIDDNGTAYTERVVKSSCCGQDSKKKLR